MYPKIKHEFDWQGHRFYLLEDLTLLTNFELLGIDPERDDLSEVESRLSQFSLSLQNEVVLRLSLLSEFNDSPQLEDNSRNHALKSLGFKEESLFLSLEMPLGGLREVFRSLLKKPMKKSYEYFAQKLLEGTDLSILSDLGLKPQPVFDPLFPTKPHFLRICHSGIELSPLIYGIVKYLGPSPLELDLNSLNLARSAIPHPYRLSFQMRKIPSALSELMLRRKSSQSMTGEGKISAQKYYDSENLLEKISLERESLFSYELYIVLPRFSEEEIRRDSRAVIHAMKALGEFSLESFGAFPCFKSLLPGRDRHLDFKERNEIIPLFFPLVSTKNLDSDYQYSPSSLLLHRRDDSLGFIDLFNPQYDSFSAVIVGKTGTGKSVLSNLLTRALLHDPNISIIKVDVGGSHSKETESLGGIEYKLSLDRPSGINPFLCLKEGVNEASISVLSNLLSVLMTEEGESGLSKEIRAELERALFLYSNSSGSQTSRKHPWPSIDDFLDQSENFPRKSLLYRWSKGGIYQNAFFSNGETQNDHSERLRYYNFSEIHQASDLDFGQGGFSLVMAQFNLEMIKKSGQKLVFIADETPFFIKRCFSFFKFSTANVRKFGGSFISISQKSTDLVVASDQGIIENSPNRFLFSLDGEKELFQERFGLSTQKIEHLNHLSRERGKFSEVLYQDKFGSRIFRIILSPEEYWSFSSTREDNQKIERLLESAPGLSRMDAINILSRNEAIL